MVSVEGAVRLRTLALLLVLAAPSLPVAADGHAPMQVFETLDVTERGHDFGRSVAWHGDGLVLGSPQGEAVRVMALRGGLWSVVQELSGTARNGDFGWSVAVDGDLLAVGAPRESIDGPGIGAVHVYRHNGAGWAPLDRLVPANAAAGFGRSVAVDGDWIAVGAPDRYIGGTNLGQEPSVHLFKAISGGVEHRQTLRPESLLVQRQFGRDVELAGARLLVGAPGTVHEDHIDPGGAFVYVRSGNSWSLEEAFTAGGLEESGGFGSAVDLTEREVFVCDDSDIYSSSSERRALRIYQRGSGGWSLSQTIHDVSCTDLATDGERLVTVGRERPYLRVYGPSGTRWAAQEYEANDRPTALAVGPRATALAQVTYYSDHIHLLGHNTAPIATAMRPGPVHDLDGDGVETVTLDGLASHDGDGDPLEHFWYDKDGQLIATGANVSLELPVGTHPLRLAVSDPGLGSDVVGVVVRVLPPPPPAADFSWLPAKGTIDDTFRFVDESTSEYGHVISWEWDLDGDGTTDATGPTPSRTFDTSGIHHVTLTVRTDIGTEDAVTKRVYVRNLPPEAHAGMDQIIHDDGDGVELVDLDGGASTDRDGRVRSYSWEREGRKFSSSESTTVQLGLGVHDIDLTVSDDQGARDTDRVTILILDGGSGGGSGGGNGTTGGPSGGSSPTAEFSWKPHPGPPVHAAAFTDASSDRDGRVVMWWYDVGADGSYEATEPDPVLSMGGYGARDVRLTVTDDDGQQSKTIRSVFLTNGAPDAVIGARATDAYVGQTVVFVDNSTDPENALAKRSWDFGDGATSTEQAPAHVYREAGTFTVELTVTDDGGKTDVATLEVTVREVPPGVTVPAVAGSPVARQAEDSPFAEEQPLVDTDGDGRPDAPAGGSEEAGTPGFQATTEDREPGPLADLGPGGPWLWLGLLLAGIVLAAGLVEGRRQARRRARYEANMKARLRRHDPPVEFRSRR